MCGVCDTQVCSVLLLKVYQSIDFVCTMNEKMENISKLISYAGKKIRKTVSPLVVRFFGRKVHVGSVQALVEFLNREFPREASTDEFPNYNQPSVVLAGEFGFILNAQSDTRCSFIKPSFSENDTIIFESYGGKSRKRTRGDELTFYGAAWNMLKPARNRMQTKGNEAKEAREIDCWWNATMELAFMRSLHFFGVDFKIATPKCPTLKMSFHGGDLVVLLQIPNKEELTALLYYQLEVTSGATNSPSCDKTHRRKLIKRYIALSESIMHPIELGYNEMCYSIRGFVVGITGLQSGISELQFHNWFV